MLNLIPDSFLTPAPGAFIPAGALRAWVFFPGPPLQAVGAAQKSLQTVRLQGWVPGDNLHHPPVSAQQKADRPPCFYQRMT